MAFLVLTKQADGTQPQTVAQQSFPYTEVSRMRTFDFQFVTHGIV